MPACCCASSRQLSCGGLIGGVRTGCAARHRATIRASVRELYGACRHGRRDVLDAGTATFQLWPFSVIIHLCFGLWCAAAARTVLWQGIHSSRLLWIWQDALKYEHHSEVDHCHSGACRCWVARTISRLANRIPRTQGSSLASSLASGVIGSVNAGVDVGSRVSNSNALPLFVLLVILIASVVLARIVFSNFRAALVTIFSCRCCRCEFDVETEENPLFFGACVRALKLLRCAPTRSPRVHADAIREDALTTTLEGGVKGNTAFKYEAAYARKLYFSSRKELMESDTPFDMAHVTAMQAVVNMARRLHGDNWEEVVKARTTGAAAALAAEPVADAVPPVRYIIPHRQLGIVSGALRLSAWEGCVCMCVFVCAVSC